ncbi:MAG TPA: hypothetical protein VFI23_16330 [Rhizomicrobium sp.]|nr:hypothetical protein [Rhizomicrobium sp.]
MTDAFIKFYYGAALTGCAVILAELAEVEYRGVILPPAVMCLVLAALAAILLGDWLLQSRIETRSIE